MKRFLSVLFALCLLLTGAFAAAEQSVGGLTITGTLELEYATQFRVDYCEGGYNLITNSDGARFLTIPEGAAIPEGLDEDIVTLQMPLNNLLISSTPTTSLINAIGALDAVTMTTQDYSGWYIDDVKVAMDAGKLTYIGSYKEPDFEYLAANTPSFSVFSTMLDSVPEVAEKLTELKIPFMRDTSTYETHPLGRIEWVKLYGVLLGREEEAQAHFDAQKALVESIDAESTGKTVAMFYITSKGDLYTRNAGDYMVKMLELAGGVYALPELNPEKSGTQKINAEDFFVEAGDADYIIYIWSMGGKPDSMAAFLERSELLKDFKAVQNGDVWFTTPDYFQVNDTLGAMILDFNKVLTNEDDTVTAFTYLFKLQ
ncbi:MAG: ABC transporter substrate-binding protein [Clostridia bacterium]|nr:ABC transporter substrate-binding protein [Clostridia bacterium]